MTAPVTTELILLSGASYRGRELAGARLRGLLALLADDLGHGCGTARLVEGLWPDERPENPAKALQIVVSRARTRLGADIIVTTPTGYRLSLREDQVDAALLLVHAAAATRRAAAGDHAAALAHAEAGLALCGGGAPAGDGEVGDPLAALRGRRAPAQRSLVRARALALSRLARPAEAVEALADLAGERPHDEEILLELLRCEAATAGASAALARYDAYRVAVRDGLGSEPGEALQALHLRLLREQAPRVRHGIPAQPNQLLGRADDIAAVSSLLRRSRVTSIVGPGGLGKTRLAWAVGAQAEQRTVHVVPLAGVGADGEVVAAVASALGAGESRPNPIGPLAGPRDVLAGILAAFASGPGLLVLDNCEHVLRGAADLVHAVVSASADVRVLTTSRAPLGLSSESVYRLPELDLPTAAELFGQRARAARADVALPTGTVEELCRRLDGLPLAVELAAARVRAMAVAEIARGLEDRFGLLRGAGRDTPSRHHTLHAVVDWSWNLLTPSGQAAMRALSVFPDGFTTDAARRLLGEDDVVDVLEHLVDQSLLKVADTAAGARFRMLETVREFSAAQRDAAGETDHVTRGFLAWARAVGLAHHAALAGADPFAAAAPVRPEEDNLVQALRHGLARSDGATVAATSAVLAGLWVVDAKHARLLALAEETAWLLSHYRPSPELVEATRAAAALCAAHTLMLHGPRALRALVTLRRLPPAPPTTLVTAVAVLLCAAGEIGSDRATLEEFCDSPTPALASVANALSSYVWESQGDHERALKAARRMVETAGGGDTPWLPLHAHSRVGELLMQTEQAGEARRHLVEAVRVYERLGASSPLLHQLQWGLVLVDLQLGDVDEAEHWLGLAAHGHLTDAYGMVAFELGARAEIQLVRGDVEPGLARWRQAVAELAGRSDSLFRMEPTGLDPWELEVRSACVVAHVHHGRADLVRDIAADLPRLLATMLANPAAHPPAFAMVFPVCGALLLAVAMVDLDRGRRTGDRRALAVGARLVALAERFHFVRGFQPAMSPVRARQAAERADSSAYEAAAHSYADLDRDGLRAAACAAMCTRDQGDGSRLYSLRAQR